MRPVLWLLFLFALAVALTLAARFDTGYVLVVIPPWRLEMSFVMASLSMLGVFVALYAVAKLLHMALSLPADVRAWRHRRRSDKADEELTRATAAYLSGQPGHARKLAASAFKREGDQLAALVAAHAALAEGDRNGAQVYIDGLKTDPGELSAARQAAEARLAEAPPEAPAP